ncbi:tyrosine-type recombinase/integrase [Herbiconiux sp. P15]|uniref:tyrosine-type recombinase/integrase n=1 Tax=Herbiconiux liukaitaii TaxID=3342799 RepID=UPI0035BA945C
MASLLGRSPSRSDAIEQRCTAPSTPPLIDLTYAAHLRIGEVMGLQRRDLDLNAGVLRVSRQLTLAGKLTQTKTGEGRSVELPAFAVEAMADYLNGKELGPMQPLFVRPDGKPLLRSYVQRVFREAQEGIGPEPFHFHDLRHAGLTLYAQGGATIKETMDRGGHSTQRAALIYQHAAAGRKVELAGNLDLAMRRPAT